MATKHSIKSDLERVEKKLDDKLLNSPAKDFPLPRAEDGTTSTNKPGPATTDSQPTESSETM